MHLIPIRADNALYITFDIITRSFDATRVEWTHVCEERLYNTRHSVFAIKKYYVRGLKCLRMYKTHCFVYFSAVVLALPHTAWVFARLILQFFFFLTFYWERQKKIRKGETWKINTRGFYYDESWNEQNKTKKLILELIDSIAISCNENCYCLRKTLSIVDNLCAVNIAKFNSFSTILLPTYIAPQLLNLRLMISVIKGNFNFLVIKIFLKNKVLN